MAGGLRDHGGGIQGLVQLLDEHGEAIEFDLLAVGLRLDDLGTERLTWRDLLVVVRQSPLGSALDRSQHGEDSQWTLANQLGAIIADRLDILIWQNGGGKGDQPEPILRPGVTPRGRTFGRGALPMSKFNDWWNRRKGKGNA